MPKTKTRKPVKTKKSNPSWKPKQKAPNKLSKFFKKITKIFSWTIVISLICFIIWLNRTGLWLDNEHYNVVYSSTTGDEVGFINLDPINQELLIFKLPSEGLVKAVYGYGDYKVGSLLKLGDIEKLGPTLLQKSVQELFGLITHAVVILDHKDMVIEDNQWINKLAQATTWSGIRGQIPLKDAIRFSGELKAIRQDKIQTITVGESRLVRTKTQPDGSIVFIFDISRIDGYLTSNLSNVQLAQEEIRVAVINTSGKTGLASQMSRLLTNSGIDVVSISDNQDNFQQTTIKYNNQDLKESLTSHLVNLSLDNPLKEVGDTSQYRADIAIFLGTDYWEYLNKNPNK